MSNRLSGKVALVTGANTGMGKAIATAFAREGAAVVVADLVESKGVHSWDGPGLTTVEAIEALGGKGAFLKLDVGDEKAFESAVGSAVSTFGGLDILVNNAGVVRASNRLHTFSAEDLDFCYRVNTRGAWNGTMAAIRYYLAEEKSGQVLNIVSTAGINPYRDEGPYALTKAAAAMLVRNAASEYAADGIRVNGICPTWVRTGMTAEVAELPAFHEFIPQFVPMGRMAEVTEIAEAAVFLCSDQASFITGVLLPVDGGESVAKPDAPHLE